MFLLKVKKRQRFLLTSLFLALGFVFIQALGETYRISGIILLSLATVLLFTWSLWEGLGKNATLLTLVLPPLFTLGVGFFWFLLPTSILARIPIVLFYSIGIYALSLTANIYTVSAVRTIALLRAAKGIGFVLTLVTSFLILDTVISMKPTQVVGSIFVFMVSFPLFLQGLWTSSVDTLFDKSLLLMCAISSLVVTEIFAVLYFWPTTVIVGSLFLTTTMYILLGLSQARIEQRLFSQTVREYLTVGLLVLLGMFIATRWA